MKIVYFPNHEKTKKQKKWKSEEIQDNFCNGVKVLFVYSTLIIVCTIKLKNHGIKKEKMIRQILKLFLI